MGGADRHRLRTGSAQRGCGFGEGAEVAERPRRRAAQRRYLHRRAPAAGANGRAGGGRDRESGRAALGLDPVVADPVDPRHLAVLADDQRSPAAILQRDLRRAGEAGNREGPIDLGRYEPLGGGARVQPREHRVEHGIVDPLRPAVRILPVTLQARGGGGPVQPAHRSIQAAKRAPSLNSSSSPVGSGAGRSARSIAMPSTDPSPSRQRALTAAAPVAAAPIARAPGR